MKLRKIAYKKFLLQKERNITCIQNLWYVYKSERERESERHIIQEKTEYKANCSSGAHTHIHMYM